jgi:hypothetical protein
MAIVLLDAMAVVVVDVVFPCRASLDAYLLINAVHTMLWCRIMTSSLSAFCQIEDVKISVNKHILLFSNQRLH